MEKIPKAVEEASERLRQKKPLAEQTRKEVDAKRVRFLDPENLQKRVARLLKNPLIEKALVESGVADELRTAPPVEQMSEQAQGQLERVLGGAADFMPSWFLARGAELRRTVGRVRARTSAGKDKKGTGFLVGPRLLLTNSHVLDWSDIGEESLELIAPHSSVELDYEEQFDGTLLPLASFRLDPSTLLLRSSWDVLDYVLVAVEARSVDGRRSIDEFGHNRIAGDIGKINKGEPVFIVQHPNGQPKQVVLQNNRLIDRDELIPYLTYEADTDVGSSGSPVFNRQWEVVALHHATEIARNAAGEILAKNGQAWTAAMGASQVKFLDLNEGVRISRIVADWSAKLAAIRGGGGAVPLALPERCSAEGANLLDMVLRTQQGASPVAVAAPVPGALPNAPVAPRADARTQSFPRPD